MIGYCGEYKFPGGVIDENETSIDAAQRELYEEFNILIDKKHLIYHGEMYTKIVKNKQYKMLNYITFNLNKFNLNKCNKWLKNKEEQFKFNKKFISLSKEEKGITSIC